VVPIMALGESVKGFFDQKNTFRGMAILGIICGSTDMTELFEHMDIVSLDPW